MKKSIFLRYLNTWGALASLAAMALFAAGCSGLTESGDIETIETSSQFNATALKASIVGNMNATNFSRYLAKRFANKSARTAADTRVVIVTKSLDTLDGGDIAAIKSVYEAGGAVVVVDPAADKIEGFQEALGHFDDMGTVRATGGIAGSFCDAYIFNNNGAHLVVDCAGSGREGYTFTEEDSKVINAAGEEGSEDESAPESADGEEEPVIAKTVYPEAIDAGQTETDYAPLLDEVIKWIEAPPAQQKISVRAASGGVQDITELTSAASFSHIFQVSSAGTTYYDGSDMTGSAIISNTQYVWECYCIDDDTDYYLVKEELVIPNSGMYNGIWKHYHFPLEWKECGLYMTWVSVESKLLGEYGNPVPVGGSSGGAVIPCSSPATTSGVSTISSGISWQIEAAVIVTVGQNSASVGGVITGGVSFHKSTTYDLTDLSVVNNSQTDGANAKFDYTTNKVSTYNTGSNTMRPPADLAVSTAQFTHFWRWEVHKPKLYNGGDNGGGAHTDKGRFGMSTGLKIQYEEAAAWGGSGSTKRWQLNKEDPASNFTWWFPQIDRNYRGN